MPTILRFRGFNILIWTEDHGPAHVHCIKAGKQASFWLHPQSRSVSLRSGARNVRGAERRALERFLVDNLDVLYGAWRELHGHR